MIYTSFYLRTTCLHKEVQKISYYRGLPFVDLYRFIYSTRLIYSKNLYHPYPLQI